MDIMVALSELDDWVRKARYYTDADWQRLFDSVAAGPLPGDASTARRNPYFMLRHLLRTVGEGLQYEAGVLDRLPHGGSRVGITDVRFGPAIQS
jgi:hypothetical protein